MNVSFNGFNESTLTFACTEDIAAGAPVKMTDNGTVGACANGDEFVGVCVNSKMGYVGVQMTGYVTMPYSGTAPEVGYAEMVSDGADAVKTAEGGKKVLVTDVDTANKTVGFIM